MLIDPPELARQLASDDAEERPILLDVRWALARSSEGNREDYLAGHIPGAAFLDLESGLSGPKQPGGVGGRHPMPTTDAAQEAFQAAGVRGDRSVVVYDGANSVAAARAWWLLGYYGIDDVRVLDGGYAAWTAAGMPVESGETRIEPGDVVLSPGRRRLLEASDLEHYLDRHQVIDARPADRFRGENEVIDPVPGHVPGAISIPAVENVDASGRFLSPDDLEMLSLIHI